MVMKACVVTATRAEYGLLRPLMQALKDHQDFELQLIVSGTHLSPEFGLTWKTIVEDGFAIDEQVDMLISGDTQAATVKSLGLMVVGMADALRRLSPDFLVILGDRYEMLGVASAAQIFNIPVIHLCGGEITEGANDDAFRHAITKLSCLHFTATEEYRRRVIQMGENPESVFNVGAIGLDNIFSLELLSKNKLEESLGVSLSLPYFLVTYHPATALSGDVTQEIDELMEALLSIDGSQAIVTLSNADCGGRRINQRIQEWVKKHPARLHAFSSLGQLRYLSAMKHCLGVVGNSSSGIVEAPSLGVGTLNIGMRQAGRIQADSIINCDSDKISIIFGLERLVSFGLQKKDIVINPYGSGGVVDKIMSILSGSRMEKIRKMSFYDCCFDF